jgi:biopolymer transport protein ExbD
MHSLVRFELLGRLMADAHDNEIGAVTNWLEESRANFGDRDPVVIQPAPTVRHQRIMQVLGAIASAQWPKVSLR